MNKASLDRGLLKCTYYKTYKDEDVVISRYYLNEEDKEKYD